jgi:hypothetical protein
MTKLIREILVTVAGGLVLGAMAWAIAVIMFA